jgi:DNA-binding beta-propeller fold protein YncE
MRLNKRTGLLAAIFALAWLAACGGGSSGGGNGSTGGNAYVAIPEANAVASYRVSSGSGDLKAVLGSPFKGGTSPISLVVHPSGKYVYTANQGGNDISLYAVNPNTGELTEVLPRTPAGLNPTSLAMDSGGDLLFVVNQTSNTISVYSISSSDGSLKEAAGSPFATGSRPVALALSPSGKFLYVASSNLPRVFGYSVTSGTGGLQAINGSPFAVGNGPTALVVDPSEHFVYVTNFIDNTVSGLTIDPGSGALATALDSPFVAGTGPISVTVHPTGKFLYVTNISSNNVSYIPLIPARCDPQRSHRLSRQGPDRYRRRSTPRARFSTFVISLPKTSPSSRSISRRGDFPAVPSRPPATWLRRPSYLRSEWGVTGVAAGDSPATVSPGATSLWLE